MQIGVSIKGGAELERKLATLEKKTGRKVVGRAFRDHAKIIRARIVRNLSGHPVGTRTGLLLAEMTSAKIRSASRSPSKLIRIGVVWPTREEFGIAADDKHFFPAALEYGHRGAAARPFMRPAVDDFRRLDVARLARAVKKGIEREAGAK